MYVICINKIKRLNWNNLEQITGNLTDVNKPSLFWWWGFNPSSSKNPFIVCM